MQVVITGVGRGLGRAMTEAFIARGHTVAGCTQSETSVAELRAKYPTPHLFSAVDVTDFAAVNSWADEVIAKQGPPDMLICNAAVINQNRVLWEVPVEEFDRVTNVNIKGVFHTLKAFLPAMVARKSGKIITLSSGWGRSTSPEVAPYCATKYAVEGMTLALASELPEGMLAVPLNPGVINTDMLRSCFAGSAQDYPAPKEWAEIAVPFLLGLSVKKNGVPQTVPGE